MFLARWFEWALGATVAEWAAGRLVLPRALGAPWAGLATLGAAVASEWHVGSFGLYVIKEPLYGVAFALLLYAALLHEPVGAPSAAGRFLAGIGLYSYSLYLLHRPIQLALEPVARWVATWPVVVAYGFPSSLVIMAASTPFVLWASRAFYRRFEEPAIQRARSL
jgi:peptidoglycan/LPS O-acetylase OafA/YrhL